MNSFLLLFVLQKSPSRAISIRAIESEKYQVIDIQTNEVLEEIEESRAFFQVPLVLLDHTTLFLSVTCYVKIITISKLKIKIFHKWVL